MKKKNRIEKSEGNKFLSFLFLPLKKLWFLNCPPNFLGSMSYCIKTIMIIRILWLTRRDFLNLKTTNQGGQLGIRMNVEKKKEYYELKTGAITKSTLIGF